VFSELLKTAAAVIVSVGGSGAIILGLSAWLGRLWADRLMAGQRSVYEREIEDFKAKALQSLEHEKAIYQHDLEQFKAQLGRDSERSSQTFRERVALYKQCCEPALELITSGMDGKGAIDGGAMAEFERKRLVTAATLGMFAPLPVFEAYNETIDYIQDCFEKKREFEFSEFRRRGFLFLSAIRRDLGIDNEDLIYRGSR